jgi:hypothetical protein
MNNMSSKREFLKVKSRFKAAFSRILKGLKSPPFGPLKETTERNLHRTIVSNETKLLKTISACIQRVLI